MKKTPGHLPRGSCFFEYERGKGSGYCDIIQVGKRYPIILNGILLINTKVIKNFWKLLTAK